MSTTTVGQTTYRTGIETGDDPLHSGGDKLAPAPTVTTSGSGTTTTETTSTSSSSSSSGFTSAPAPVPVPTPPLPTPILPAPPDPVGTPLYLAADYAAALSDLLPQGRVWPKDPASIQQLVLLGLAKAWERSDAAAQAILAGSIPGSPLSGFLPEWEATLGLPDPCLGSSPTFAQRFAQVGARFTALGGSSRKSLIAYAAALGFTITITAYSATHPGPSGLGITGSQWNFTLGVAVTANSSGLSESVLQCELNAIKPAETTIILLS